MISIKKQCNWLITGGAGFIGSNLCNFLIENKQNVVCVDNFSTGKIKNLKKNFENKNLKIIKQDIRLIYKTKFIKKVDFVVHLAALGSVSRSIKNPVETNSVNVEGSIKILELAEKLNAKKFIFASSSSVYGNLRKEYKIESDNKIPISPYGISKLTFEKYAEFISINKKIKVVGLRFFNVFGPNQNEKGPYAAVIPLWCKQMINNKKIELNGDGKTSRDFTYIDNVIYGIIQSCFYNQKNYFEVFNLACGKEKSLKILIQNIENVLKKKAKIIKKPFRIGDIKRSKASIAKAEKKLNYSVQTTFEEGIKKYLNSITNI